MTLTIPYNVLRYLPLASLLGAGVLVAGILVAGTASAQVYISDADAAKYNGDSYIDGRFGGGRSIASQMSQKLGVYAGADYSRSMVSYGEDIEGFKEDLNGGNVYVGLPLMDKLSLELGYNQTETGREDFGKKIESKVKLRGVTADLVGNLPLDTSGRLRLLGAVGVGGYRANISDDFGFGTVTGEDDDLGFRLGLGAQVQLTETLGVRGMVRYVDVNFEDDFTDKIITTDVGLNVRF